MVQRRLGWSQTKKHMAETCEFLVLTSPPRFDLEATSALWLTSPEFPPDCMQRLTRLEVGQVGSSRRGGPKLAMLKKG